MKYSYKGDLKNIPDQIVYKLLERQVEQGNPRDVSVFEKKRTADKSDGGFNWAETPEGTDFWHDVLSRLNFCIFFEKYPELRPYEVGEGIDELKDMLHRIEAKLDQLLRENNSEKVVKFTSGGIVVQDKSQNVEEVRFDTFNPGDRVRVKPWKEIKKLTEKDLHSIRIFDDGHLFTPGDRLICGFKGVVVSPTNRPYITINVNGELYALAPQALEKLKP